MDWQEPRLSKADRDWTDRKSIELRDDVGGGEAEVDDEYVEKTHEGGKTGKSPLNRRTSYPAPIKRKYKDLDINQTKEVVPSMSDTVIPFILAKGDRKAVKKIDTPQSIRVDWYGGSRHLDSTFQGFNLETWWIQTSMPTRVNLILLVMLLVVGLLYLIAGTWLVSKHFRQTLENPYMCHNAQCYKASQWLTTGMNLSMDPCDNFYEFMCGNYRNESGNTKENELLSELILDPAFKVEFGANSILAHIVKDFENHTVHDQTIRYYQACLNEPIREEFGLEALVDTVESVFGTRNFSHFEETSLSMEQIGANMLSHTGDATYIHMAFYTYPYIAILRPSSKMREIFFSEFTREEILIRRIFQNLMPLLGVHDATQIDSAYQGVKVLGTIESLIAKYFRFTKAPKKLPLPAEIHKFFEGMVNTELNGYCPPMGIQLNIRELLGLFIKETFRYEFYDLMALKYFVIFEICFAQDPSKFTRFQKDYPKLSFVAPWLFGIFWDFIPTMDAKNLMAQWKINPVELPNNNLVRTMQMRTDQHIELRCMLDLAQHMGYPPVMDYVSDTVDHPLEYLESKKEEIRQLYAETIRWFKEIPRSEIDKNAESLGRQVFGRNIHVDVIMPLVSGMLHMERHRTSYYLDSLNFTQDHLRNSFKAIKYSVGSARHNWLASTNTEPTVKWWGSGYDGTYDMQCELFDIRKPLIRASEFDENLEEPAGQHDSQWQKFLGRPLPNYLFFFHTIFDEPYVEKTLFLESSGVYLKIIRTIYSLLSDTRSGRHTSYFYQPSYYGLISSGWARKNRNRTCSVLWTESDGEQFGYEYVFRHNYTTGEYSWEIDRSYHSLLALKQSFQALHQKRESLSKEPFNWALDKQKQTQITQRLLPGKKLEKYSEDQLFFMAYVRNACRGSWRTHPDQLQGKRFRLEKTVLSLLMQMEEFATTWNCKRDTFMNNMGQPRCIRWVP